MPLARRTWQILNWPLPFMCEYLGLWQCSENISLVHFSCQESNCWKRTGGGREEHWVNPYLAHTSHDLYSSGIPILQDLCKAWKDSEKHLRYNQCEKLILYREKLSWKPSVQTRDNLGKEGKMQLKSVKAGFDMERFIRVHSLHPLQWKSNGHSIKLRGRRLRRNKKYFLIILHIVNLGTFCRIWQVTRFPKMRRNTRQVNDGQSYWAFINCYKLYWERKDKRKIKEKKKENSKKCPTNL